MTDYARVYRFWVHTLGTLWNGGGGKYQRAAGSRGDRALPPPVTRR